MIWTGKLNTRIELLSLSDVSDGYGGATRTWANDHYRWCNWHPVIDPERFNNSQVENVLKVKLTTRYNTTITEDMRVRKPPTSAGTVYEILEIIDVDEKQEKMEITIQRLLT